MVRGAPKQGSRGGARQTVDSSPVGQAEDEELQEGRLQQQVPVACAQLSEARDLLRPLADDLQGPREQVVELPHIPSILLPKVRQRQLLELGAARWGQGVGPWTRPTMYSHIMPQRPDPRGEGGTEMPSTSCLPVLSHPEHGGGCWKERVFLIGHPPQGVHSSIWSAHRGSSFFSLSSWGGAFPNVHRPWMWAGGAHLGVVQFGCAGPRVQVRPDQGGEEIGWGDIWGLPGL